MAWTGIQAQLGKAAGKFGENRYVKVIAEGMMGLMPITLVGSFCLILAQLLGGIENPPAPVAWLAAMFNVGSIVGSSLISIFVVITLAAVMAKVCKQDVGPTILIALASFLVVTPVGNFLKDATAERPTAAIDISYLGSKGMFVAIIVSILAARLYAAVIDRNWTIKMPEQVPPFVSKTFEQLIPVTLVLITFMLVNAIFTITPFGNVHDFIYAYLQMPLQSLGSNVISACVLVFVSELLWFFGIHGSAVTRSLMTALFGPQGYANMEAVAAGELPQFILSEWFIETFKGPRAMALAFLLIVVVRSTHLKSIGKVAAVPSLFTITEPMKFGIPMVLNPWLLIPMSFAPVVSILMAYYATVWGFLPIISVNVSRFIPAPFQGFIAAGWQGGLMQILQFAVIVLLYLPFLKQVDRNSLSLELPDPEPEREKAGA